MRRLPKDSAEAANEMRFGDMRYSGQGSEIRVGNALPLRYIPVGTTVLDAARSLGVDIDSVCGGRGICGRCAVRVDPIVWVWNRSASDAGDFAP